MTCSKKAERLLHALLDGELDAMNAVDFETHLTTCAACAAEFEHQQEMRAAIRQIGATEKAPQRLRLKIEAMIDEAAKPAAPPTAPRAPASGWRAKGLSLAIAACLALAILLPGLPPTGGDEIREQLVASHVRSLLAEHLTDIQSSDRHTVRPWFNGKVDVAPPTVDLAKEGFPCLGGRLDYIENQVVAVLVYKRGNHVINLFVRSAPDEQDLGPRDSMFRGYNLRQWRRDGMEFWAVTDASESELDTFQAAYMRANESIQ